MPSETAVETLGDLDDALGAAAFDDAERLLERLAAEYDSVRGDEAALRERVVSVRDRVDPPDGPDPVPLTRYVKTQAATSLGRSGVLVGTRRLLTDPESAPVDDVRSQIADLRDQEQTLLDAAASASAVVEEADVQLPALLVVTGTRLEEGPYVPDRDFDLVSSVENVGGEPAAGVRFELDAPDGVSASPAAADLGTLAPGERAEARFTVRAAETGEFTLTVVATADGDPATQSNTARMSVVGAATLAERALEAVTTAQQRIEDSGAGESRRQALLAELETAERKIEEGLSRLDAGKDRQADGQFGAATRVLGAFLNTLDAGGRGRGGTGLSASTRRSARRLADAAIELLSLARDI